MGRNQGQRAQSAHQGPRAQVEVVTIAFIIGLMAAWIGNQGRRVAGSKGISSGSSFPYSLLSTSLQYFLATQNCRMHVNPQRTA